MNCHSQVWADSPALAAGAPELYRPASRSCGTGSTTLPDFVYFDHSAHVQKGVGCSTCHGPVDQMPLTYKTQTFQMSFCLDCHQNPGHFIRPEDQVFNMAWQPPANQNELGRELVQQYHVQTDISCDTCHR